MPPAARRATGDPWRASYQRVVLGASNGPPCAHGSAAHRGTVRASYQRVVLGTSNGPPMPPRLGRTPEDSWRASVPARDAGGLDGPMFVLARERAGFTRRFAVSGRRRESQQRLASTAELIQGTEAPDPKYLIR